jgi:hypothetical protein
MGLVVNSDAFRDGGSAGRPTEEGLAPQGGRARSAKPRGRRRALLPGLPGYRSKLLGRVARRSY